MSMTVVQYQLRLQLACTLPEDGVWFKDEGGRENCVEFLVELFDCDNRKVPNSKRHVQLKFLLYYEDETLVQQQEI